MNNKTKSFSLSYHGPWATGQNVASQRWGRAYTYKGQKKKREQKGDVMFLLSTCHLLATSLWVAAMQMQHWEQLDKQTQVRGDVKTSRRPNKGRIFRKHKDTQGQCQKQGSAVCPLTGQHRLVRPVPGDSVRISTLYHDGGLLPEKRKQILVIVIKTQYYF